MTTMFVIGSASIGCQVGAVSITDDAGTENLNVVAGEFSDTGSSRTIVLELSAREWTVLVAHDAFQGGWVLLRAPLIQHTSADSSDQVRNEGYLFLGGTMPNLGGRMLGGSLRCRESDGGVTLDGEIEVEAMLFHDPRTLSDDEMIGKRKMVFDHVELRKITAMSGVCLRSYMPKVYPELMGWGVPLCTEDLGSPSGTRRSRRFDADSRDVE